MAQKVNIILVDDLDGSEAHETVAFGLDGDQYEIDLSSEHAAALRQSLITYAEKGRVIQRRRGRKPAALAEAQAKAAKATGPKTKGTRRRTSTVEQIEAGKS